MERLRRPALVVLIAFAVAGSAGCAARIAPAVGYGAARITYRQQSPPFCGRCETIDFVMTDDGVVRSETGYWQGAYRAWRKVRRTRRSAPREFQLLKEQLAAYKPAGDILDPQTGCKNFISDQGGAAVEWWNGTDHRVRVFDFGCLDDPQMNAVVREVPSLVHFGR